MTPDEQEALSRAHYARRVLRLESGRYAVFDMTLTQVEILDDPRDADLDFHLPDRAQKALHAIVLNLDDVLNLLTRK